MHRVSLEHLIRAAAEVSQDNELVIVGSQAILGQFPDAPTELLVSREADIYPRNHPERSDAIDGNLGDGSYFDESFGYYAHGVGPETAKVPAGWEDRLVPIKNDNTGGATGWCLEAHDLVLSKCVAGRERDWEFVQVALQHRLVDLDELLRRVADLPIPKPEKDRVKSMLQGIAKRIGA